MLRISKYLRVFFWFLGLTISVQAIAADIVWVEDSIPTSAIAAGDGGDNLSTAWVQGCSNICGAPCAYSGSKAMQSSLQSGLHQMYFYNASAGEQMTVATGDKLFVYVYLDACNPPSEVMIQFRSNTDGWEHRAFFGQDRITYGTLGTNTRRYMGPLPQAGSWVRLEIPAAQVGLEGHVINGMAFTLFGGRALFDKAGRASTLTPTTTTTQPSTSATETVMVDDSVPAGTLGSDGGDTWYNQITRTSGGQVCGPVYPQSGRIAFQSASSTGLHQIYFHSSPNPVAIRSGDKLFAYVYLDACNKPSEVMLQFHSTTTGWEHRAFFGEDRIFYGTTGTASRRYVGPLPAAGGWVRLEVPANQVGLEGQSINGMAFSLFGGRAIWDNAGVVTSGSTGGTPVTVVANSFTGPTMTAGSQATVNLSYSASGYKATACAIASTSNLTVTRACACVDGNCSVGVTAPAGFSGTASFAYTVSANGLTSNTATASMTVMSVPVASGSVSKFGCALDNMSCSGPSLPGCSANVANWGQTRQISTMPLGFDIYTWTYQNAPGKSVVEKINNWYKAGAAAGLTQDKGRSFDGNHVTLYFDVGYPQMNERLVGATGDYGNVCNDVLSQGVTFAWQSYGFFSNDDVRHAKIEYVTRESIRRYHESGGLNPIQGFYRGFYESNALLVQPSAASFDGAHTPNPITTNTYAKRSSGTYQDRYSFLSPLYLHSIGYSGSDTEILKPLIFASASIKPALKDRIMKSGMMVPTLMYLFKKHIAGSGDLRSEAAHRSAYTLPAEADYGNDGSGAPRLNALVNAANALNHIPPVARIKILSSSVQTAAGVSYRVGPYLESSNYNVAAAIRPGETLVLTLDLGQSWRDGDRTLSFLSSRLRGNGTVELLNASGSQVRITVPFGATGSYSRSDFLLLASDGVLESAPAYVSVRHIQPAELGQFGL